jgi:hypothetical protein
MPLESTAFQTAVTEDILKGQVTAMDVLDPTEDNERTSLLEADDEFDVELAWQLTGAATPTVDGSWIVSLFSDDLDGLGAMAGLIAGPATIPLVGGIAPLKFRHTFKVGPPIPKAGVYVLTATINHSPTGDPAALSEMFGHATTTPIEIFDTMADTNRG